MFHTQTKNGVTFLTADALSGVCHGFSTRLGGVSPAPWDSMNLGISRGDSPENVTENYRRFCAALGADVHRVVLSHQIHEDVVRHVTEADTGKGLWRERDYPSVDGMVTDVPHLPLVVFSAACNVTLLSPPGRRPSGACPAAGRATALGIAAKTVQEMTRLFGCDPAQIRAAIGPAIRQCCFETDGDVPEALRAALGTDADPYITWDGHKYHIDLQGINALWLRRTGVAQPDISDDCTACRPDLYWSHRRMGSVRGSQIAMISLEECP